MSYTSPLYKPQREVFVGNNPTALAYFQPAVVKSNCDNASASATVFLDTQGAFLSSTQIELQFNPQVLNNLVITPTKNNLFGETNEFENSINDVRSEYGRVSFILNALSKPRAGNKPIATLSFNTYPKVASMSTQIKFLNKSTATQLNSRTSILTDTIPLTVLCQ